MPNSMDDFSSPGRASTASVPEFLTPRSKVAKMLADIDNAPTPPHDTTESTKSSIESRDQIRELPRAVSPDSLQVQSRTAIPFESDDDSDDDIRKPVGRAARRMQPLTTVSNGASSPLRPSENLNEMGAPRDVDDLYSVTPRTTSRTIEQYPRHRDTSEHSDLFVTPAKSVEHESADELPELPMINKGRLAELVAQKRAERLAEEAEAMKRRKQKSAELASSDLPAEIIEDPQGDHNPDIDRIMSDAAKPTRKASKKAILEMERETQRLARQQALTHQMKVKKQFKTSSLFARFNFRPEGMHHQGPTTEDDATASSAPNSDDLDSGTKEPVSTPPSSPPTPLDRQRALVEKGALSKLVPVREDSLTSLADLDAEVLPDITTVLSQIQAPTAHSEAPKQGLKLARLGKKAVPLDHDSSDDELEILRDAEGELSIFDKAKKAYRGGNGDCHAIHALKHLAHIGADAAQPRRGKKEAARPAMNPVVLGAQLRMRARDQARAQQLERIAELKAKGIDVQTTEEREREAEAFESLLEKARQEAAALRKAEKAAAAREGGEGLADASDDESEDGDYEDSEDGADAENDGLVEDAAEESDDEEEEEDEDENEGEEDGDHEAADSSDEVPNVNATRAANDGGDSASLEEEQSVVEKQASQPVLATRKPRRTHVIVDDEDEEEEAEAEPAPLTPTGSAPVADDEEQDPFAAFGFGLANNASSLMSPTQAFNATMQTPTQLTQQDSMDILRRLVPPSISSLPSISMDFNQPLQDDSQATAIPNSQVPNSQQVDLLWETQLPETPVPSLKRGSSALESTTPGWEPSQDAGLPLSWQATNALIMENTADTVSGHDTQSTVRLRISESPVPANSMPRRRRLVQRQGAIVDSSDEEDARPASSHQPREKNAFREMARKRKEALSTEELADAQKEMKGMMDDQAEESEDEYAGLGGDDYVAPENEQDRAMIDSSQIDVDEQALAAHFAERQRVADEAEASKLYKDLMTGALRRKQANMFDLGEDEDDLAVRKRQMRQREEARKRKLLLQDDNIAGLAEGRPSSGKDAFLKAIADDDDGDDDVVELPNPDDETGDEQTQTDTQTSQGEHASAAMLKEISGNKRRRNESAEDRLPAKQRRTQASAFRAPTSLLEVKESVSFLLDEADNVSFGPSVLDIGSDSEKEGGADQMEEDDDDDATAAEEARQNDGGFAPDPVAQMPPPRLPASQRRTAMTTSVVDRLMLKRSSSTSEGAAARTAWGSGATGGFKVPSLLRRATTNVTNGANERGVTTSNGLSRENSGLKMGGSKKSSLAYQARADERKAQVEASVRRRAENTARIAQLRRGSSNLRGSGLAGQFE